MEHSSETKAKLSVMRQGKSNPFFGRKHSEETRAKMAEHTRQMNYARQYDLKPCGIRIPEPTDLHYLAGIIDGEGSVRFKKGRPFVAVYNTDRRLMDWIVATVGGTITGKDLRGRQPGYQWTIAGANDVAALCVSIAPILKIKSEDAKKAITFLRHKYGTKLKY